jgi:hypothetical protein
MSKSKGCFVSVAEVTVWTPITGNFTKRHREYDKSESVDVSDVEELIFSTGGENTPKELVF